MSGAAAVAAQDLTRRFAAILPPLLYRERADHGECSRHKILAGSMVKKPNSGDGIRRICDSRKPATGG
jgi:hypothetical protein